MIKQGNSQEIRLTKAPIRGILVFPLLIPLHETLSSSVLSAIALRPACAG
jgi:hypothetical protein